MTSGGLRGSPKSASTRAWLSDPVLVMPRLMMFSPVSAPSCCTQQSCSSVKQKVNESPTATASTWRSTHSCRVRKATRDPHSVSVLTVKRTSALPNCS